MNRRTFAAAALAGVAALAIGIGAGRQPAGDKTKASEAFKSAQSVIDSIADKGLFHKNKAARHKSRLAAKVKALALGA